MKRISHTRLTSPDKDFVIAKGPVDPKWFIFLFSCTVDIFILLYDGPVEMSSLQNKQTATKVIWTNLDHFCIPPFWNYFTMLTNHSLCGNYFHKEFYRAAFRHYFLKVFRLLLSGSISRTSTVTKYHLEMNMRIKLYFM